MEGVYYKEWSRQLGREMEFKVYGTGGVPVLALPGDGGRFYDWENNGMPEAAGDLIRAGRLQLFCADSIDGEAMLAASATPRQRAAMQQRYLGYLALELAARITRLNRPAKAAAAADADADEAAAQPPAGIWCAGIGCGALAAALCRLRRPDLFAGAICLSGRFDTAGIFDSADDLGLRCSPLAFVPQEGFFTPAQKQLLAQKDSLILCAGQSSADSAALAASRRLDQALQQAGLASRLDVWGYDVTPDWYWWTKQWGLFSGLAAG